MSRDPVHGTGHRPAGHRSGCRRRAYRPHRGMVAGGTGSLAAPVGARQESAEGSARSRTGQQSPGILGAPRVRQPRTWLERPGGSGAQPRFLRRHAHGPQLPRLARPVGSPLRGPAVGSTGLGGRTRGRPDPAGAALPEARLVRRELEAVRRPGADAPGRAERHSRGHRPRSRHRHCEHSGGRTPARPLLSPAHPGRRPGQQDRARKLRRRGQQTRPRRRLSEEAHSAGSAADSGGRASCGSAPAGVAGAQARCTRAASAPDLPTFLEIEGPDEASVRQAAALLDIDYSEASASCRNGPDTVFPPILGLLEEQRQVGR